MLAIVIPYYKLTFFETTLESLVHQTDKRFKVYIGDDASLENPINLIEKYRGKFNFHYHRFESNLGETSLVKQWERCIGMTRDEDWIMILGDDDYLGENIVASWYENFSVFNEKSNVVRFASKLVYEELKEVSNVFIHPVWEDANDSFCRKFDGLSRSSLSEYFFSRLSYQKYGFFDYPLAWNSDDRAWLDFSDNKPIFTINSSIVFVRISTLNISGRNDNNLKKSLSEVGFYKLIISSRLQIYKRDQRLRLLRKYRKEIQKSRNLNFFDWSFLMFYYFNYLDVYLLKKGFNKFFKITSGM
jgi:hypothetical protein